MCHFRLLLAIICFSGASYSQGSLKPEDYLNAPISFTAKMDSVLSLFGPVRSMTEDEAFGGKGPIMRGDSVLPGDTVYTTHLRVFKCDSITLAFNDGNTIEYYVFTTTRLVTARGIRVGDSKEQLFKRYPHPTDDDQMRSYDDLAPGEDELIEYGNSDDVNGIAFFFSKGRIRRIYIGRGAGC